MNSSADDVPTKIWFGDYLLDERFLDARKDLVEIGRICGFQPVFSSETPDTICLINFHLLDVLKTPIHRNLRRVEKRYHMVTEPKVIVPALDLKIWSFLKFRRLPLGAPSHSGDILEKPHRESQTRKIAQRRLRAVLVNGNKFSWVSGELYTLRREVLTRLTNVDFYGAAWDIRARDVLRTNMIEIARALPKFRSLSFGARFARVPLDNYKGVCRDKIETIAEYKVCLVIENSQELVTEKLVDAWIAGCIPVYVGPDLKEHGVPDSTYIKAEPSVSSVQTAIAEALTLNHEDFHEAITDWVDSSQFRSKWGFKEGWQRFFRTLLG